MNLIHSLSEVLIEYINCIFSFFLSKKYIKKKGKKTINVKLEKYLTPLALAILIMDDGGWAKPGVRLSTISFKLEQVEFLSCLLNKNEI